MLILIIIVFNLLTCHLIQIIAQNRIVKVQKLPQMCMHQKSAIISSELTCALKLYSNHLEVLTSGCFGSAYFEIHVFDIDHDELGQAFASADGGEHVFPVFGRSYLMRPHCFNVDYVHTRRYLIHEDEGTDSTEQPHLLLVKQN